MIDQPLHVLETLDTLGIAALLCDAQEQVEALNQAAIKLFAWSADGWHGLPLGAIVGLEGLTKLNQPDSKAIECRLFDRLDCLVRVQRTRNGGALYTFEDASTFYEREQNRLAAMRMVIHDLRTPVSAIKSYAELVGQIGPMTPQQQQFLQRIQLAVRSTGALITDLLDIAWIDSGVPLEPRKVNLAYLVQSAVETLEERANSLGITLHLTIAPDLPPLMGDPNRLERVFTNLIVNAIKYSGQGKSVDVTVSQASRYLTVAVTDTGIGIPLEHLPHIFDRFYRVPQEDGSIEGSGLGLAIVKAIVEKHGGHVEVRSQPGQGSTFMVVLPLGD